MDNKIKKAVEEMSAGKERGFNTIYSNSYNTVYLCAQDYAQADEDIFELMHIVYVEAYKSASFGQASDDIIQWLTEITSRRGNDLFKKKISESVVKRERLNVKKAQQIYDSCCILLGLKPTTIEEDKKKVLISRKVTETVKKTVTDEIEGAVKDEVKKGIKAAIASLSTKAKVALMAGAVTTTAVTVGVVGVAVTSKPEESPEVVSEEEPDLSLCFALYTATTNSYEGEPLVHPVKTGDNEYTFPAEDISKHFEYWEYAAFVIEDNLPDEMAVAYITYGAPGAIVGLYDVDKSTPAYIPWNTYEIVFVVVPKEDVEEEKKHLQDFLEKQYMNLD